MPIYYIDIPTNSFYDRQLPNGTYRYAGYYHSISFCIDSKTEKTEEQVFDWLDSKSVDYLVDCEGYIMNIE